jgi:PAS domain S-box-containing protein
MTAISPQDDSIAAQEQTAQTEALFNSIGDGAIATDEFGKIIRINPIALHMLGYSEKEILNKWFPRKIIALDEEGRPINLIDRPITQAFLTGQAVSEKMRYRKKNGDTLPVSITVSPIILDGRPIGAIEVFRDITMEQEIDRMKSEFISLASHQLRTPLSAIKTYAHMLIDGFMGDLTTPQRKSLHTIIVATDRMNELISTLLNITRIESGSITIAPKTVNLAKLLDEIVKELSHAADAKHISLNLIAKLSDPTIKTDSLIVKEVVSNLVSNAIKYTPDDGQVTITLKARASHLTVSVSDTGFGIPKQAQEQIFTKFFRASNIVHRETSGTGLGLYLVQGLTTQLGGKVWFKSAENEGSTFYLSLPRQQAPIAKTKLKDRQL